MKTALILGCSHAAGSEMHLDPNLDLAGYTQQTYGLYNSYPSVIAQSLGYHPMNHAIPGGSNDAMLRILESFVNPYSNKTKPNLIIACWTGANRTEVWDFENAVWQGLAPGKQKFYELKEDSAVPEGEYLPSTVSNQDDLLTYQKHWVTWHSDRWSGRLNKIKNILALNAIAELEEIPVVNIDSFDSIQEFTWPANVYRPMDNNEFSSWSVSAGFKNTQGGHFFADAHKLYAKKVIAKLDERFNA